VAKGAIEAADVAAQPVRIHIELTDANNRRR
jgi:hypothetical protein